MENLKEKDIVEFVIEKVCEIKKQDHDLVNAETSLASVGVDSLSAVLICGYLEEKYDIEVEPILMFECKTAKEVAIAVLDNIEEQR